MRPEESLHGVVTGGYMEFRYENGELYTYTTHDVSRQLTNEECKKVADYTQGQWSDGIGEGFDTKFTLCCLSMAWRFNNAYWYPFSNCCRIFALYSLVWLIVMGWRWINSEETQDLG